jgi:hypothetical protein
MAVVGQVVPKEPRLAAAYAINTQPLWCSTREYQERDVLLCHHTILQALDKEGD